MILVDTSIWVELLREPRMVPKAADLVQEFVTCGPVVQEVLQGFSDTRIARAFREHLLAIPCLDESVGLELYIAAAEIYREGRRQGYTIRSGYDCLIAAIAIKHDAPIWHQDRDFAKIAKFTPLKVLSERLH